MAKRRKVVERDEAVAQPEIASPGEALTSKYRPRTFEDVVGHEAIVRALKSSLEKGTSRCYLFTGGSGFGKTTLARIAAREVGCKPGDLLEIDAATNTGIDEMRQVTSTLAYPPIGGGIKAVIVDEAHALSKAAIQSLLKITEDPPPWLYWFLCTTEPGRILPTMKTRCFAVDLKPVSFDDLVLLLEDIVTTEQKADGAPDPSADIIDLCAEAADGSPRQAIANLAVCAEAQSVKEAQALLSSAVKSAEGVELARLLVQGAPWKDVQALLRRIDNAQAEGVRHVVWAYVTKVVVNAKSEQQAGKGAEILDAFSTPFQGGTGSLALACVRVLLS